MTTFPGPQPPLSAPAAPPRSGFLPRAVMAVVLAAGFAALLMADAFGVGDAPAAWWLLPLAILVAARGAGEWAALFAARGLVLRGPLVQFATVGIAISAAVGAQAAAARGVASPVEAVGWTAVACAVAIGAFLVAEFPGYEPGRGALDRVAASVLIAIGLGLPLAFMVGLRLMCGENLGPEQRGAGHLGVLPLLSLVGVVKGGDVVAYLVGSLVGRWRMAPRLSPGKTWEGAVASLAASLAAAWFLLERTGFAAAARPWGGWPVYGLAVGAAGMLGDLAESLVKRELAAKDSGRLLGGLGGVLDLVDAFLFAAPVAWLLWLLGR